MNDSCTTLRRLIWLYFWMLLFEGALRKWFMPGLSNVLLIIRDPIIIVIYAVAMKERIFPASPFILWIGVLASLCFAASIDGIGTLPVTLYGMRADFLHLPLIFLMPRALRQADVKQMGYALLLLLLPMALLSVRQFQAGPNSPWNVGAGGEIGGQLYAAQGKVRASGTFSFATGLGTYMALTAAFLLNDLLGKRAYPRWLTFIAVPALVLMLVVSGSRTAVISVAVVCVLFIVVAMHRPEQARAAFFASLIAVAAVMLLSWLIPVFHEGVSVHRERFAGSGGFQNGIVLRLGEDMAAARDSLPRSPLLGLGLGVGTNVGASLLHGRREFVLGEGEWQRVILESGPILGLCYILLRLAILMLIGKAAYEAFQRGQPLSLLLVGVGGLDLAIGQFGQPTTMGFAVFIAGLALTAARNADASGSPSIGSQPAAVPGRSPYAQRLHGDALHDRLEQ